MTPTDRSDEAAPAPSWILDLRKRLSGGGERMVGPGPRIVVAVPLFVRDGALWTILGEDVVAADGDLARVSFPAAQAELEEPVWSVAASALEEILGIEAEQALQIGELDEIRSLGGLRIMPLVVAIPRPDMAGRNLGAQTDGGLALFQFQVMSLLEPQRSERRQVELPGGTEEVEVITVDDHPLWGPTLDVLERLLGLLATD